MNSCAIPYTRDVIHQSIIILSVERQKDLTTYTHYWKLHPFTTYNNKTDEQSFYAASVKIVLNWAQIIQLRWLMLGNNVVNVPKRDWYQWGTLRCRHCSSRRGWTSAGLSRSSRKPADYSRGTAGYASWSTTMYNRLLTQDIACHDKTVSRKESLRQYKCWTSAENHEGISRGN